MMETFSSYALLQQLKTEHATKLIHYLTKKITVNCRSCSYTKMYLKKITKVRNKELNMQQI